MLLALAVAGPALWLGGVKPWTIPVFAIVVLGLLIRRCLRTESLRVPAMVWLGFVAVGATALQWIPLPTALLDLLAPGLRAALADATVDTQLEKWPRLSVHPDQTALELARLLALTGLFIAAAQLSWRLVARYVAVAGSAVAVIGLVHELAGTEAIYGIYRPRQMPAEVVGEWGSPLLTTFVNPNHQSGLLLLGLFAAAATALDFQARARAGRADREAERLQDRAFASYGMLTIQLTALVLSMSRAALVALMIVAPIAAGFAARGQASNSRKPSPHSWRRWLALATVVLTMVVLAATQGAAAQLTSLVDAEAFVRKFRVAREGLALIPLSPVLGTGRGTFVDLFPFVDSQPGPIRYTHLESTPVAWIVEWGPAVGGLLVVALPLWWWRSLRAHDSPAAKLLLCGLLAMAIQSGADFSLDYLGVTAPAVALAGALTPSLRSKASGGARQSWRSRTVLTAAIAGAIIAVIVSVTAIPGTWSQRRARNLDLRARLDAGERPAAELAVALERTPLDPFVHLGLAHLAALDGDWGGALVRAEVAARLWPASLDAHLLAARSAAELGEPLRGLEQLRRGLEQLRDPVPPRLADYLAASFPDPSGVAAVAPRNELAWAALSAALSERSPVHAKALAAARMRTHPEDPEALRVSVRLALGDENPGLALHYARLLVQMRPREAQSQLARGHARLALGDEQLRTAVNELEAARANPGLDDPSALGELLVAALLRRGDLPALMRAQEVIDELLARRADPQQRRRQRELADAVANARARANARPEVLR